MSIRTLAAISCIAAAIRLQAQGNADQSEMLGKLGEAEDHIQAEEERIGKLEGDVTTVQATEAEDLNKLDELAQEVAALSLKVDAFTNGQEGVLGESIDMPFASKDDLAALDKRVTVLEGEDPGDVGINADGSIKATPGGPIVELPDGGKTDTTGAAIDPATGAPATGDAGQVDPSKAADNPPAAPADTDTTTDTGAATAVVSTDPAHGGSDDTPVIITQDPSDGSVLTTPVTSGPLPDGSTVVVDDTGVPTVTVPDGAPEPTLDETDTAPEGTPAPADQAHVDNPAVTDVSAPATPAAPADDDAAPATTDAVVSDDPNHHPDGDNATGPVIITQDDDGTVMATPVTGGGNISPGSVVVDNDGTPTIDPSVNEGAAPTLGDTVEAPVGTPAPADIDGALAVGQATT